MSFEAPITAPAGVPRVANIKNYGETEIYRESDIDGEAAIREVLLASVHMHKNYPHSNRRMTFRLEESIEKFAR